MNSGIQMIQQVFSQTVVPANVGNVLNVIPRNVGLIKGFWVQVTATVTNNGTTTAITPTDFAGANVLSQISFQDLNNNTRIQCTGWYLNFINSLKSRMPYATSFKNSSIDSPTLYGANFTVNSATASIAAAGSGTVNQWYWVPMAYSDSDYRGAIYANVVNATMQLQLTLTSTVAVASGDDTQYMYKGNAPAVISSATVTVYQVYMDQIPQGPQGPVLPMLDLSTIYELKTTTFSALNAGQDFPMQYANFRDFLSTVAVYWNGTGRLNGSDINYWALQSANFTNLFKVSPTLQAIRTRGQLHFDLPPGCYYFGSREKPIATTQYGNMELVINPITAGASAYVLVGYEDFALINALTQAGSLAAS